MKRLVLGLAFLVACGADAGDDNVDTNVAFKILGANDLVPVRADGSNIPEKYRPLLDAFGFMSNGCTATHVGDGIAITAGHCFHATTTALNQPCPADLTVTWGLRGGVSGAVSRCEVVLAQEGTWNRDYAIFRVSPAPAVDVPVYGGAEPAPIGSTLTVFSHPRRRPLEWSKTCTVQPASAGGPIEGYGLYQYSHQCDTESGSSGASMLLDDSLVVAGIHDGGNPQWNFGTHITTIPLRDYLSSEHFR